MISFDKVTYIVDKGKAVDIFYTDISKAFDFISHSIQLVQLTAHGLDGCTVHWVKKWLDAQAHGVVVNQIHPAKGQSPLVFHSTQYLGQFCLVSPLTT